MPTVTIQIANVKRRKNNISFSATSDNQTIERTVGLGTFDNWETFSEWLIQQNYDFILLPDKEKSLEITFHNEVSVDPETGIESTTKVLDNVIVS